MVEITQQFLWLNISLCYSESDRDAWHVIRVNGKAKLATKLVDKMQLTCRLSVRDVNSGGHGVPVCSHVGKTAPFIEPLPLQ